MKWFPRFMIFCIFNAILVTGDELLLSTDKDNVYRYNTKTKETKKIAGKAAYMACDYERKFLYYTHPWKRNEKFTQINRMDPDSDDIRPISYIVNRTIEAISVDPETGNVYYVSPNGVGFLSYTQNYINTIISTARIYDDEYVYGIGFHGYGSSKRVYWSTLFNLYRLQTSTSDFIDLEGVCTYISILDNGMVCDSPDGLFLANLDGVKIESLPNTAITTSKLEDINPTCDIDNIETVYGNMYIVCSKRILKLDLKTGILYDLIPEMPSVLSGEKWYSVCPLPIGVLHVPSATILPVSTIAMIVSGAVIAIVLIVILTVTILKCRKKHENMPISNTDQIEEPRYTIGPGKSQDDFHVYDTIAPQSHTEYLELNTLAFSK